jgi:Putative Ig domain/Stage II sporulation protein
MLSWSFVACDLNGQAVASQAMDLPVQFVDSMTGYAVQPDSVEVVSSGEPTNSNHRMQRSRFSKSGHGVVSLKQGQGSYQIQIHSPDYEAMSATVALDGGNTKLRFLLDPIHPPEELKSERINELHRSGQTLLLGFIVDDETGEPLNGVRVVSTPSGKSTRSDARGFFEFYVPAQTEGQMEQSPASLLFRKQGWQTENRKYLELWENGDVIYQVRLKRGAGVNEVDEREFRHREPRPAKREAEKTAQIAAPSQQSLSVPETSGDVAIPVPLTAGSPTNRSVRVPKNIRVLQSDGVTIDYISMQTYVKRSLPAEWFPSWANYTGGSNSLNAGAVGIRTYAIGYINSPRATNYDICGTTACQAYGTTTSGACNTAVDYTAGYVMVNSSVRIPRGLTEYSAENNSLGFSCGDGFTQPTGGCISDPVCTGESRNGHGRGMCQWGSAKWATGLKFPGNSTSDHTTTNGYARQDWIWILTHYYPTLSLVKGAEFTVSDDVKVAGAAVQVRMCADGSISSGTNCPLVTTKAVGSTGTIIGGPTQVTSDGMGYTWWKIQWSDSTVGWSPENWLERVIPVPAAPSGLVASAASSSEIDLTWLDNSGTFEDGFKVEWAAASAGPWTQIGIVGAGITNYADTTVTGGSTNYYRVRAYNVSGNSAYSGVASAVAIYSGPLLTAIPNQTVNEGNLLIFTNSATFAQPGQNKTITYSLNPGGPPGAVVNPTNGVFTWTPTESQGPSTNTITVRATDNGTPPQSDSKTFTVLVNEVNQSPVLASITNRTIHAGMTISITNSATDPDLPSNLLSFSLDSGSPAGALINGTNGILNWTSSDANAGNTVPITVRVTDNGVPPLSDAKTFNVNVIPRPMVNPILSGGNVTLSWPTIPGTIYRVQYKTNLSDASWINLLPSVVASSATASKTDSLNSTQRFYRVFIVSQ